MCERSFVKGTHEVCPNEDWVGFLNFVERKEAEREAERDFHDLAYDVQQRERERPVESKARPDRAVQASWTNRAKPQVPQPPPKARPKASQEPAPEPVPKPAPKPAAEMMVIDADDDSWGDWPKGKNWWKKQRKRERQKEAEAEERRVQELRDQRIAQELADEQALDPHGTRKVQNLFSSDPNSHWHCSICMSEVEVGETYVILPCLHMFHQSCALAWFNEGVLHALHAGCQLRTTTLLSGNHLRYLQMTFM